GAGARRPPGCGRGGRGRRDPPVHRRIGQGVRGRGRTGDDHGRGSDRPLRTQPGPVQVPVRGGVRVIVASFGHRQGAKGIAAMSQPRLTVITRVECHLCDVAKEAIARVAAQAGVEWTDVDVDSDPALLDEYWDRVPVILLDGKEHGYWRVEEDRLLRDL